MVLKQSRNYNRTHSIDYDPLIYIWVKKDLNPKTELCFDFLHTDRSF